MRIQRFVPLVLALSLGVAGCDLLPTGGDFSALLGGLSGAKSTSASAMIADTVASLNVENQMNLGDLYAGDTTLKTQSLETMATGSLDPRELGGQRELERLSQMKSRMQDRMRAAKGNLRNFQTTTATNADGTKTEHSSMVMNNRNDSQTLVIDKTYAVDGTLTEVKAHFVRQHANGLTYTADRDRALQADGSWIVTFKSVITNKAGKTKTVSWTRTVATDGSETGDGTIVRFDGSTVTVHIVRDASGNVTSKTVDSTAKVNVDVSASDDSSSASVKVTDTDTDKVNTTTVADTSTVDPSTK